MNADLATPSELFQRRRRYRERTGQPTVAVSVRLPDELLPRLAKYGNRRGLSLSETLRLLIERGWDRR